MTTPNPHDTVADIPKETKEQVDTEASFAPFSFDQRIVSGLKACGYTSPTPVQQAVISALLTRKDVIALANTGTGKTAAFLLPLLQYLASEEALKRGPVRALVLAPTRELVLQIQKNCIALGLQTGFRCGAVYGGAGAAPQKKAAKASTIIVATPGRLLDFIRPERNPPRRYRHSCH